MKPSGMLALCGLALAVGGAALAQSVISARSGVLHYVEGQVYLGDQQVESKFGNFPSIKENEEVRTTEGRAEVLLTPGVFLRLGENSSFRLITNRLIDTRLELLSGSAVVEADDVPQDNSVTVVVKDAAVHLAKKGLYRFDFASGQLRVFDGLADVAAGEKTAEVKEGHLIALNTLAISRFDKNVTDALDNWSARRGEYVAMANVQAANSLRTSGGGGGYYSSGWYYNPFFGMYSFVPGLAGGLCYSPYGFAFFNPYNVYQAYWPGYYYYPTYGGSGGSGGNRNPGTPGRGAVPVKAPVRTSPAIAASHAGYAGHGGSGGFARGGGGGAVSHGGGGSSGSRR